MSKLEAQLGDLTKAVSRLAEVLKREKDEFIRDSAIQRFEFCFDLSWKTMKTFLEEYAKVQCVSPRACIREAYRNELIKYDQFWLKMADMRNQASHTYFEPLAEEIYAALPEALQRLEELVKILKEKK